MLAHSFNHLYALNGVYMFKNLSREWGGTGKGLDNEKVTFHNACSHFTFSHTTAKSYPNFRFPLIC